MFSGEHWPSSFARLPFPERAEGGPVPADKRLGLDHNQRLVPIEEFPQCDQQQPSMSRGVPRAHLAFLEERELFSEEQILRNERRVGSEEKPHVFFHHHLHQRQSRFAQQVAHPLLQQADAGLFSGFTIQ
jgi:hypothetical protein